MKVGLLKGHAHFKFYYCLIALQEFNSVHFPIFLYLFTFGRFDTQKIISYLTVHFVISEVECLFIFIYNLNLFCDLTI